MWHIGNKKLVETYGDWKANPSDEEYGTYLARELMALGFVVKRLNTVGPVFAIVVEVLGGTARMVLFCKQGPPGRDLPMSDLAMLADLRNVCKADRYAIVSNGAFGKCEADGIAYEAKTGIVLVANFSIGMEVLRVASMVGLVPKGLKL